MRIYNYHIAIFSLYKAYGDTPFCTTEALRKVTSYQMLTYKNLIKRISKDKAIELRPEIKEWKPGNWQFWVISDKGLYHINKIKDFPDLMAKHLLLRN
jgi:hypothetical protein